MKRFVFIAFLMGVAIFGLSACSHESEEKEANLEEPQIAQETDEIIPEAPASDESDGEEAGGEGGGIGGPLVELEYTSGSLILDDFGSMMSISSPVTITGKAPRVWFFEGVFPVTLMTLEGDIITESYASGEWLSPVGDSEELGADDMIEFSSTIEFVIPEESTGEAKLRFSKDNTSGEAEDEYVEELVILLD